MLCSAQEHTHFRSVTVLIVPLDTHYVDKVQTSKEINSGRWLFLEECMEVTNNAQFIKETLDDAQRHKTLLGASLDNCRAKVYTRQNFGLKFALSSVKH